MKTMQSIPVRDAYPVKEACVKLSISPASAYRYAKLGKLRLVKIGGRTVVPASEIARLANGEAA